MNLSDQGKSSDRKPLSLSIVFSFRNEAEVIPELLRRLRLVLSKEIAQNRLSTYELIFVNDASSDLSKEILLKEGEIHKDIKIINMSRPFGHAYCLFAGLKYSTGEGAIYMDADLQDPPEVIHEMLNVWFANPDIEVVHTRRVKREKETLLKLAITKFGYWVIHKSSTFKFPIEAGDFKLMSRKVINYVVDIKEKQPYFRGLVWWVGFKGGFVSYVREPRFSGDVKNHLFGWYVINNFFESALISFSLVPLKMAFGLGAIQLIVTGVISFIVISKMVMGEVISGTLLILLFISTIAFFQFICLGFIGLYLGIIYQESKNRPNYIIESLWGFPEKNS